jgi:hypothetical protein
VPHAKNFLDINLWIFMSNHAFTFDIVKVSHVSK